jgi:hypothetical protein
LQLLSTIKGPWALIYWQAGNFYDCELCNL